MNAVCVVSVVSVDRNLERFWCMLQSKICVHVCALMWHVQFLFTQLVGFDVSLSAGGNENAMLHPCLASC